MRIPALIFVLCAIDVCAGIKFDLRNGKNVCSPDTCQKSKENSYSVLNPSLEQHKKIKVLFRYNAISAQQLIYKRNFISFLLDVATNTKDIVFASKFQPESPSPLNVQMRNSIFKSGIRPWGGTYIIHKQSRPDVLHQTHNDATLVGIVNEKNNLPDSISYRKRQNLCYTIGLGGTVLIHAGLYQIWYKDYPSSGFHFFNDNHEWFQMDKFGHAFSSYYLGIVGIEAAKWAGIPENKQWKWALFGSIFQYPIEIWDGFSAGWGASTGDLLANTIGTVLSAGQHALWKEQKLIMKLSFTPSSFARIRPNVLGSNLPENVLKDYNGQTYWLCYSPLKRKNWDWLGLGIGYGADGMVGGEDNIWKDKYDIIHNDSYIKRYRQYYLGLDYNLTKIKTNIKALKTFLFILNCIKLPSPALELSNNNLKGHWLMF